MAEIRRQLAAIMFTDIVGYTSLMGRNENAGLEILRLNRKIHQSNIRQYNGIWVKEMGDGNVAYFDSALQAVQCACEIQKKLRSHGSWKLRIGIHLGEISIEHKDIFGDGVNIAARLESIADPGGIYVSDSVISAIRAHEEIKVGRLGSFLLRNVAYPVEVFAIHGKGLPEPSREKLMYLSGKQDQARKKRRTYIISAIILLMAMGIWLLRFLLYPGVDPAISSIAVLPLANLTGDQEQEYFVAGMQDALITELSKIGSLRIISRQSTLRYRESTLSMGEIAKQLRVDAVVEGSVYKSGNNVSIQIQLIKPQPVETHLLGTSYDRELSDVINLHKEITRDIAGKIHVKLTAGEIPGNQDSEPVNPEAYEAYLKGTFHRDKLTREDLGLAENYFKRAVELDPEYALGYVGLASVGLGRGQMGYLPWLDVAKNSVQYLDKAMRLDSTMAEVHFYIAGFSMWGFWQWEKAEKEFERTININPNYALALVYYSQFLCWMNRPDEGLEHMALALDLDPYNTLYKEIYGMNLLFTKRYQDAQALLEGILEIDPESRISQTTLRSVYHMQKKYEEAFTMWKRTYSNDPQAINALDQGYLEGGYNMALQKLAEMLIDRSRVTYVPSWWIGTIYTRASLKKEALKWLKKAYEAHDQNMPAIYVDPIFDYLREEPEFIDLVEKMNFPG
jgi:adenylate cyclase